MQLSASRTVEPVVAQREFSDPIGPLRALAENEGAQENQGELKLAFWVLKNPYPLPLKNNKQLKYLRRCP